MGIAGRWMLIALVGCSQPPETFDDPGPGLRVDASTGSLLDAGPAIDAPDAPPDGPPPCVPSRCSDLGYSCGAGLDDGCGQPLDCGTCSGAAVCGAQHSCAVPAAKRQCMNGWCWEAPAPFSSSPNDLFARTATDVWMVGDRGVIQRFDGTLWSAKEPCTQRDLRAIWMVSATDGWVVGEGGVICRWNGTAWSAVTSGTTVDLTGVYGSSATNVWAVGDGVSRRWNGTAWIAGSTTAPNLEDVWVASNGSVFATGGALVYQNVSGTWTARNSDTTGSLSYPYFNGLAGAGTTAYAVGGVNVIGGTDHEWVWKWDGATWTHVAVTGTPLFRDAFSDGTTIFAPTASSIWNMQLASTQPGPTGVSMSHATGAAGEVFTPNDTGRVFHYKAGAWTNPTHGSLNRVTRAFAIGDQMWFAQGGEIVEWNGGLVTHDSNAYWDIVWISGPDRDNLWAVDYDGAFGRSQYAYQFDGRHWKRVVLPGPGYQKMHAVYASATEVVLIGNHVWHRDGTTWVEETMPVTAEWKAYSAVGSDLYAIGKDANMASVVAVRRAGTWTAMAAPAIATMNAIAAVAANDIWIVGSNPSGSTTVGAVAHWNGSAWTTTDVAGSDVLSSVTVRGGDVWATGGYKGVFHRLGNGTWVAVPSVAIGSLRTLAFDNATPASLWGGGDYGAIVRR